MCARARVILPRCVRQWRQRPGAPRRVSDQVPAVLAARELAEFRASANSGEHALAHAVRPIACMHTCRHMTTRRASTDNILADILGREVQYNEEQNFKRSGSANFTSVQGAMGIKQLTKLIGDQAPDAIKVSGSRGHVPPPHGPRLWARALPTRVPVRGARLGCPSVPFAARRCARGPVTPAVRPERPPAPAGDDPLLNHLPPAGQQVGHLRYPRHCPPITLGAADDAT